MMTGDAYLLHSMSHFAAGIARRVKGDVTGAARQFFEARQTSAKSGSLIIHLRAATESANMMATQSHLHRAADQYREILQQVGNRFFHPRMEVYIQLGNLYYEME